MATRLTSLLSLLMATLVFVVGCSGGGSGSGPAGDPVASPATVEGYVHAPATATVATAQGDGVANCRVVARRVGNGRQLGAATANARGRYCLRGLPAGVAAQIETTLSTGERLRSRLTLPQGSCTVDLDEGSTLAAACLDLLDAVPTEADTADALDEEGIVERCLQYHRRNRYRYGALDGRGPDFARPTEVLDAARALMTAACDDAVRRALRTLLQDDCRSAVAMVVARLRVGERMGYTWSEETQQRIVAALRDGWQGQAAVMARVATQVRGSAVGPEDVEQLRQQLRQQVQAFSGERIDALQAMACLCLKHRNTGQALAGTGQQAERLAEVLYGR